MSKRQYLSKEDIEPGTRVFGMARDKKWYAGLIDRTTTNLIYLTLANGSKLKVLRKDVKQLFLRTDLDMKTHAGHPVGPFSRSHLKNLISRNKDFWARKRWIVCWQGAFDSKVKKWWIGSLVKRSKNKNLCVVELNSGERITLRSADRIHSVICESAQNLSGPYKYNELEREQITIRDSPIESEGMSK